MTTVCCVVTLAGAVYNPVALIVPAPAGLSVQVTTVLLFEMLALNCCVWPPLRVALAGKTLTVTSGANMTYEEADTAGFAWLVAVTYTDCPVVIQGGALYSPVDVSVPNPPRLVGPQSEQELSVQVTAVLLVLDTIAVNCCV